LTDYIDAGVYVEYNPRLGDGVPALRQELEHTDNGQRSMEYHQTHRVLAEGNFVLSIGEAISEDRFEGIHSAFYDLFRVTGDKLVEHWDTTEKIAYQSDWKNNYGKF